MAPSYEAVPSDEYAEKSEKGYGFIYNLTVIRPYILRAYSVLISVILLCVLLVNTFPASPADQECQRPAFRREWRTLNDHEKRDYLQAVQCLRDVKSRVGTKYSLSEDFAYVHAQGSGIKTHNTARFLVWHRYYLHVYEEALRNDCGYSGNLPYWDWTKDLRHIYNAPIWGSDDISFGTNGTGDTSPVPGELRGSCVTDGPFANMTLHYLGLKEQEHCFSRGFASEDLLHNLTSWLRPQIIEKLLLMPRYEDFNGYLEHHTHLAIPGIIQGDLVTFTSPNDPVLFLHHAQLDRLWSIWQQSTPKRMVDYGGPLHRDVPTSEAAAHSSDILRMDGLAPDISVKSILNTRKGRLCYTYN
ncbi:Di-copper centre-containing protein [Plenodomus tracheiphilus IPT5]|uniref:Di-copper centre-containing protein n=1 Tax=Plenodomus tracheiphilus IPT5 TaxID=1408161 RepID=A0A6A7BLX6_9PLEO|nr:Di-copper centre-containing protein [Plenodomus tracheiphilus IPT5]